MEGILLRHFDEWGDIERIKLLHSRGVGFVTYFSELSAQFAKEAMMNQSLDNDEVLNVRCVYRLLLWKRYPFDAQADSPFYAIRTDGRQKIQIPKLKYTNMKDW